MKKSVGDKTKEKILKAGVDLWPNVTSLAVANQVGITHTAVLYHFPDGQLKDAVAEYAVDVGNSRVIVQLIAVRHFAIRKLTARQRADHLNAFN